MFDHLQAYNMLIKYVCLPIILIVIGEYFVIRNWWVIMVIMLVVIGGY